MENLILHPTDLSQWYALVNEAEVRCAHPIHEDVESYLVFMLMRFSQHAQLTSSIVALDFLDSFNSVGTMRNELLRAVGDKSLLLCGLFPGIAAKRRVRLNYYIQIGQAAYLHLSELELHSVARLYALLGESFVALIQVLRAMRTVDPAKLLNDYASSGTSTGNPCASH